MPIERHDLADLPKVIADLRLDILATAQEMNERQAFQAQVLADIDFEIANDDKLTNDAKRKGARAKAISESKELIDLKTSLDRMKRQQDELEIELGFYRDELRLAIARLGADPGSEYVI